jgi:murein DD-endopeptidase MepM/ murein hydrolase activator NlpD
MYSPFAGKPFVSKTHRVAHFIQLATHRAKRRYRVQRRHFHFYKSRGMQALLRSAVSAPLSWRRRHWIIVGLLLALTTSVGIFLPRGANATHDPSVQALTTLDLEVPPLPAQLASSPTLPPQTDDRDWRVVAVRSGQTVGEIFGAQGVSGNQLQHLLDDPANANALRHIRPGQEFAFAHVQGSALSALRFERDDRTRVEVTFDAAGMHQNTLDRNLEHRVQVAHGVIESSLFDAGNQAGMDDGMVLKLANALGYDIDFAQDLRIGDSFTVIYDSVYRDGEFLHDGDIIAATFINGGKRYSAFRYTDSHGDTAFYSGDGRPLRKSFLRTPVEFTRISSLFTAGRMHPILGTMRAHRGVDYAAPIGTPIHAAGDGKITFRGWQNGYGNFVVVQHNGHVSTAYGHMSRFAALHVGEHVRQGETIGYVGMTGLATGPHLHYEFRIDGTHRDPLTVTLPKPEPLPAVELAHFQRETAPQLAKLKMIETTRLALAKK